MQICVVAWGWGRWNNLTFYHPTWEMCHYKICLNSYYSGGCSEIKMLYFVVSILKYIVHIVYEFLSEHIASC